MTTTPRDINAKGPHAVDWTSWLAGETVSTATWTCSSNLTKTNPTINGTNKITTITLEDNGAVEGETAWVTVNITSSGGRKNSDTTVFMIVRL